MRKIHKKSIKKNKKDLIEKLVYFAAIFYPLLSLPQIYKIYETKSADDFSLLTWASSFVFEAIFLLYGIKHKLPPVYIASVLWLISYCLIIAGILLYG